MKWVRVRAKVDPTAEYSVARALRSTEQALDKPAVDSHGNPLPAKPILNPKSPVKAADLADPTKAATPAETKEKS